MQVQKNILVNGYVQGVSYRKHTKRIATNLGVHGWVRNLANGSVEACLEGDETSVDALIDWCAIGPINCKVEEVTVTRYDFKGAYTNFKILDDEFGTTS